MADPSRFGAGALVSLERADAVAVEALTFLVSDGERLSRFVAISGLQPETVRDTASSPAFLLGVLDYLAGDETLLRAFAIETETHPQTVMVARAALAPQFEPEPEERRPTSPLMVRCEQCRDVKRVDRRQHPHVPGRVVVIEVPRCGGCGGGFDQSETWFDADGSELAG